MHLTVGTIPYVWKTSHKDSGRCCMTSTKFSRLYSNRMKHLCFSLKRITVLTRFVYYQIRINVSQKFDMSATYDNHMNDGHHITGESSMPWLTEYRHYWTRKEKVEGLDLSQPFTPDELLMKIRDISKDTPRLIDREFKQVGAKGNGPVVRVMTWNSLAQSLSTGKDNFIRCPPEALDWEYRRIKIIEEILTISPDIACFQEIDHFGFLCEVMNSIGYEGCFFPKPDSPALYTIDTNGPDGCAVFFKLCKFTPVNRDTVVLRNIETGQHTNQVSVIYRLKLKDESIGTKEICVATTHLKAKRGWERLRHKQGSWMLNYLKEKYVNIPLVICGDFNADPDEPVYEEFRNSDLNLESAYREMDENKREPQYTTWKIRDKDICRTIDYVWFTKNNLQPCAFLEIPTPHQVGQDRLPSMNYPSDHISLAVDFIF